MPSFQTIISASRSEITNLNKNEKIEIQVKVLTSTTTEQKLQFLIQQIKMMYLTLGFLLAKNFKPDVQILFTIIQLPIYPLMRY